MYRVLHPMRHVVIKAVTFIKKQKQITPQTHIISGWHKIYSHILEQEKNPTIIKELKNILKKKHTTTSITSQRIRNVQKKKLR